jgi:hypothetical protein
MDPFKLNVGSLHHAIIRHLIDRGHAPTRFALAAHFGVDPDKIWQTLETLQDCHGVVLHPHEPEVWVVHPFSTAPTPFVVRQSDRAWWGNCAWCSLGIAALLGGDDVTIQTTFGAEGRPVTVHLDDKLVREDLWVHFPVPMARAWENVIYTCSTMLVFESEAAIDQWSERHAIPRGSAQRIQRVYDFAEVWYGRHLDPDWRKWTTEEARVIFTRFGFEGPIWQLPETVERF